MHICINYITEVQFCTNCNYGQPRIRVNRPWLKNADTYRNQKFDPGTNRPRLMDNQITGSMTTTDRYQLPYASVVSWHAK